MKATISIDVCDLCTGEPASRNPMTELITLNVGAEYEPIAVCTKHLREIRALVRDYLAHATKVSTNGTGTAARKRGVVKAAAAKPARKRTTRKPARKPARKTAAKRAAKPAAKTAEKPEPATVKSGPAKKTTSKTAASNGKPSTNRATLDLGVDNADMRQWAKKNGYEIGDRGRIPDAVQKAYDEAHSATESAKTPVAA